MNNQIKKITLFTTIAILGVSGIQIKSAREKSKPFSIRLEKYDQQFCQDQDEFSIIAHRGFSSLEVENSKNAISLACKKDYIDGIEMDLRLTKDNHLVLSHTDFVITDDLEAVKISDSSLKELQKIPLYHISNSLFYQMRHAFNCVDGSIIIDRKNELENKPYYLTSLEDVLPLIKNKKIILDLKFQDKFDDFSKELEKELKGKSLKNITFQSEDLLSLLNLKKNHPNYQCSALIKRKKDLPYISFFDQVGIKKTLIDQEEVKQEIKNGKKISIWTIDQIEDMESIVKKVGESAKNMTYITDYPDMVGMYLRETFPSSKKLLQKKKK